MYEFRCDLCDFVRKTETGGDALCPVCLNKLHRRTIIVAMSDDAQSAQPQSNIHPNRAAAEVFRELSRDIANRGALPKEVRHVVSGGLDRAAAENEKIVEQYENRRVPHASR